MNDKKNMAFKDSNIVMAHFENMEDFLFYVRDENVSPMFKHKMSSVSGSYNFTGTNSYKEAWDLCRYSMNEGFQNFAEKFNSLNYYIDSMEKREPYYSVQGYSSNVPRFLLNIPTSMNSYQFVNDNPTINIYMNYGYSSSTSNEAVRHRGIILLSLIQFLEKKGFNVNFFGFELNYDTENRSEWLYVEIPMKKKYEKLNLKLLYFPLVHPSFLRRLIFRAKEKMPLNSNEWVYGYGIPATYRESVEFLKKHQNDFNSNKIIYISSPKEMGIHGNNLIKDYESVVDIINKKYDLDVLKKTKRRS